MCFIRAYKWWRNSKKEKITKIHHFDPLVSKLGLPKGHIFWKRITYSEKEAQSFCIATVMLAKPEKEPCWWCRKGPGWLKTSPAQMGVVSSTRLRTRREVQQLQSHWKCHHRLLSAQVRSQLPLAPWAKACQEKHFSTRVCGWFSWPFPSKQRAWRCIWSRQVPHRMTPPPLPADTPAKGEGPAVSQ